MHVLLRVRVFRVFRVDMGSTRAAALRTCCYVHVLLRVRVFRIFRIGLGFTRMLRYARAAPRLCYLQLEISSSLELVRGIREVCSLHVLLCAHAT